MAAIKYSVTERKNPQNPDSTGKFYANVQATSVMNIDEVCEHIAQHGSIWTKDVVKGVADKLVSCMEELLVSGNTIQLGNLGSFHVSCKSKPTDKIEDFSAQNIERVYPIWSKGKVFKNLRASRLGISFERVLTKKEDALAKERVYGSAKDDEDKG